MLHDAAEALEEEDASNLTAKLLIFFSILVCLSLHVVYSIYNIFLIAKLPVFFLTQHFKEHVQVLTKSLHMNESRIHILRTELGITSASMVAFHIHIVSWPRQVIGQQGTGNFYADRKRAGLSREPNHGCPRRSTSFVISRQPTSSNLLSNTLRAHTKPHP